MSFINTGKIAAAMVLLLNLSCGKDKIEDPQKYPSPVMTSEFITGTVDSLLIPDSAQFAFAMIYTSTVNPPCGQWGQPLIHDVNDFASGRVLCISAHIHGFDNPLSVKSLYDSLRADRSTGGLLPSFWFGDVYSNGSNAMAQVQQMLSKPAIAAMDYWVVRDDSSFTINSVVKFFTDTAGPFYLSTVILESGIDGSSSSGPYEQWGALNPGSYKHDFVLRASATSGIYGEKVADTVATGLFVSKQYNVPADQMWGNDTYVASILWRYDAASSLPKYRFVNAFFDRAKVIDIRQ